MAEGARPTAAAGSGAAIVGREDELAAVDEFLASAAARGGCLVLEGGAGIGKTTLWRATVDAATESGHTVLACRPVEAEARLAFAGLGDLFAGIDDDFLAALPAPQLAGAGRSDSPDRR